MTKGDFRKRVQELGYRLSVEEISIAFSAYQEMKKGFPQIKPPVW